MKIVITGGAGFIGSALSQALRIAGHTVSPLDNLSVTSTRPRPQDLQVRDVRSLTARDLDGVDTVVPLAALKSVPASFEVGGFEHNVKTCWLEGRGGQPEGYCHRQMVGAVRYLVAGGITWRSMPADFPAWDRIYAFFRRWCDKGWTAEFHDRLRDRVREAAGRDREPTAGVIDAQSVKATASVPAATRGFDGGKKVNGRKRHIVVDTLGLLLAAVVTAASVTAPPWRAELGYACPPAACP